MKKRSIFIIALAAFTLAAASTSYAYYTRTQKIPSVRVTIATGDLEVGDELTGDADAYVSIPDSNQYYELDDAEWLDDVSELKVGDQPRIQIWLSAIPKEVEKTNYSTIYLFSGSYTTSNVTVTKGELISADVRDDGYVLLLTVRTNAVKGTYSDPVSADWSSASLGTAVWETDFNDSGYYDVYLYKGSRVVKRLENYQAKSFDFYPYMTEEGEYSFKVRVVADPDVSGGKSSAWIESSTLDISASEVSDGSGQSTVYDGGGTASDTGYVSSIGGINVGDQYGFVNVNGSTYFRYPDGSLASGWFRLDGSWYLFNTYGVMQTGWYQNQYGYWFYLTPGTGVMKTGWFNDNGTYYYLRTQDDDFQGSMVTGWADIGGRRYYFGSSGAMVTGWQKIGESYYYFYPAGSTSDGSYGYLATNTTIGVFTVGSDGAWTH